MHSSLYQKTVLTLPEECTLFSFLIWDAISCFVIWSLDRNDKISFRVSHFHKKFSDSSLTKQYVTDSHFLAVHDGNVRGAHAFTFEREDAVQS